MISSIAKAYFSLSYKKVAYMKTHPIETQREILNSILQRIKSTDLGKDVGASSIKSYAEFKKQIPVFEYEEFKPYIDKALRGDSKAISKELIKWFALSSGTTDAKSKFIPTSADFLKYGHYKASKYAISSYIHRCPESRIFEGKNLIMGGSHSLSSPEKNIRTGDVSAILLQNASLLSNLFTDPPLSIAIKDNWTEKLDAMAKFAIQKNVTSISGVPTWTIAFIKHVLHLTGKKALIDLWPNFELYINGGVAFNPYENTLSCLIGKSINYIEVYNASEGFFAVQELGDTDGLLLYTNHAIFYEFIPINDYRNNKRERAVPLEEVSLHTEYALIISNYSGLIRYVVGDTVTFTSLSPFKIKVTGRIKQFINSAGEEVIVHNTDYAIAQTCKELNLKLADYTVAPQYATPNGKGQHEWIIAIEKDMSDEDRLLFTRRLDDYLQTVNSDYSAKRKDDIGLIMPKIHFTLPSTFLEWMKKKNKLGGQNKVPRLCNDRRYIDDILKEIYRK